MNKKKILLLGGILVVTLLTSGCFKKKIEFKDTKSFEFSYQVGNYMYGSYIYDFKIDEDGKMIASYQAARVPDEDKLSKEIDQKELKKLEAILKKHEIYKWDGFQKSDKHVLDGYGFHMYYHKLNDEGISASGYMKYPKGYNEFKEDIIAFYQKLFEKEIEEQKTTYEE